MTEPKSKCTKWLNRVAANIIIEGDNTAKFYVGTILIDEGVVSDMNSVHKGAIVRKNGLVVKDAWMWMDQIESTLKCVY